MKQSMREAIEHLFARYLREREERGEREVGSEGREGEVDGSKQREGGREGG